MQQQPIYTRRICTQTEVVLYEQSMEECDIHYYYYSIDVTQLHIQVFDGCYTFGFGILSDGRRRRML